MSEGLPSPNPLQVDLLRALSDKTFIACQAGWGSGKTTALSMALITYAAANPNGASLFVTDTNKRYVSVVYPSLVEWTQKLWAQAWEYSASEQRWTAPNGHTIWCRSYFRPNTKTANQNSLEGINCGMALIDEAQVLNEEVAHKALGRIRSAGPMGPRLIICGLPVHGAWWVRMAEETGGAIIKHTSHVNKQNLSPEWFTMARNTLPQAEYEAMIENRPAPPRGLVLSTFNPSKHIIKGWQYQPHMLTRIAIDWGFRSPAVLFISHDPELNADVIHAEISANEVTVAELTKRILEIAWPRSMQSSAPHKNMIWIDKASGDKAGAARNDQTALSAFRVMKREPPKGIGVPFRWTTDPIKTDILNGLQRLRQRFERDEILITSELWDGGQRSSHSLARGLMSYSWDAHGKPIKKDEHHIDALRYDTLNWAWADSPIMSPTRTMHKLDRRKLRRSLKPRFEQF